MMDDPGPKSETLGQACDGACPFLLPFVLVGRNCNCAQQVRKAPNTSERHPTLPKGTQHFRNAPNTSETRPTLPKHAQHFRNTPNTSETRPTSTKHAQHFRKKKNSYNFVKRKVCTCSARRKRIEYCPAGQAAIDQLQVVAVKFSC